MVKEFSTQLYFTAGQISVTLSRDFYHNCLTKDPFSHSHPSFELHYILQGTCCAEVDSVRIPCTQGSFLLLPPHCSHRLLPQEASVQTISISFHSEEGVFLATDVCLIPDTFGGEARLLRIREELTMSKPAYTEKVRGELTALLADIIRSAGEIGESAEVAEEHRPERIQGYLMEHRFDPDCSCENLAKQMHLSTRQVQRLCLQYFGATFRELLTSMRMQTAAYRLHTTSISVGDLALQLGYASVSSFSAAYRRHFGKSPSQERSFENQT